MASKYGSPFKMKSSPAKLWPWTKRKVTRTPDCPDCRSGEKNVKVSYSSGNIKKDKTIKYGEHGQRLSVNVTKYTKSGDVKSTRSKKYSQKRWQ